MDEADLLLKLILLVALILVNAFFSSSELGVITTNDNRLKKMAEEGDKRAKKLVKLTDEPSGFLATIQIGVTLSGLLASAVAAESFVDVVSGWLPLPESIERGVVLTLITLLLSYFSLVFGELVPKRIAMHNPEKTALRSAGFLSLINLLMKPFVRFLAFSTNFTVRLFGIDPEDESDKVTEEEIRMMVDVGNEKGVIEESQKDMINNVFEFDDRPVLEVMTHRTNIVAADEEMTIPDILELAVSEGYSRLPVYREDLDTIIGILYVKDLLKYVGSTLPEGLTVENVMRPVFFVPETIKCRELFRSMTANHYQMAVAVDEYGGTAGLITMEDLLETIVGNIQDEYDSEEDEVRTIDENTYEIEGSLSIEELEDLLDVDLPVGDFETVGGLILSQLGRFPESEEHPRLEISGVEFEVLSVESLRIDKVRVTRKPVCADE